MESSKFHHINKALSNFPVGFLILFVAIVTLLFWTLKWRPQHLNAQRQKARIESLAYQVLEIRRQSLKHDRGPASEASFEGHGRVGMDLDGKPYFYQLSDDSNSWAVRIWSENPALEPTEVRIRKDQL